MLNSFTHKVIKVFALGLLFGQAVSAQQGRDSSFRKIIDSLNTQAYDHPEQVLKAGDSLLNIAGRKKMFMEYGLLLQVKGVAETSLGNNSRALENHMASYRVFDSIHNTSGKIYSLCNIAAVHINLEDYNRATGYLNKALSLTKKNDYNNLKTIYANLGVASEYSGNSEKAIEYYLKAVHYQEKLGDNNGLAITYHNIAEGYKALRDYRSAEQYELRALEYQEKSGSTATLAMVSLALGSLYTDTGQPEKAKSYLEEGGKAAGELRSPYYLEMYYRAMAEWSTATNNHKDASGYFEKLLTLRDSTYTSEKAEITLALEEKFQSSLKTKEIELLKAQKKLADTKVANSRVQRIIFTVFLLLGVVMIFMLYRNYKLKQKANRLLHIEKVQLQEKNLMLENENILVQFETLKNQVSPHFLFNSLNALASIIKTDPDRAVEFTGIFSKLFRNVLELKDRHLVTLAEELGHVNRYFYLQQLRFGAGLITQVSIPHEFMNRFLPPFALQMVVENAIKHNMITSAKPLAITIEAVNGNLIVTNNLQQRKHAEDSTGTGIKNIILRYRYLGATEPVFEKSNGYYIVKLPLIEKE